MPKQRNAARDPFKQLERLPRRADLTVLGGKRAVGLYLQEDDQTFQPDLLIWLDGQNGMILGSEAINPQASKDNGVSEALAALVEALLHPQPIPFLPALLSGAEPAPGSLAAPPKPKPGLPAKITLNDEALAQAARAVFEPLNVPVEYQAEIPAFDQAFQSLSRHLGGREDATPPEPFAWELAHDLLTPLYAAAMRLWETSPWDYMLDHPTVEITLGAHGPQPDVPKLYASILGANGEVFGVACYTSLEAFERTLRRGQELIDSNPNIDAAIEMLRQAGAPVEGLDPTMLRMLVGELLTEQEGLSDSQVQELMEDALVCFFNTKDECDPTYLDWMKARRLAISKEGGVPFFTKTSGGEPPRQPDEREARALTAALDALGQYFGRFGEQLEEGAAVGVPLTLAAQVRLGKDRLMVPVSFTPTEEMYSEDIWLDSEVEGPDEPASAAAVTTVYRFQVMLDWMQDVWRRVELTGDQTLHDLHETIQEAFNWDDDHPYAFFLSGKAWDRATEYTSPYGMNEGDRSAAKYRLENLSLKAGKQFLYIFDFGEELRHTITLETIQPGKARQDVDYPRITERHGKAPPQYPDLDEDDDEYDEDGDDEE